MPTTSERSDDTIISKLVRLHRQAFFIYNIETSRSYFEPPPLRPSLACSVVISAPGSPTVATGHGNINTVAHAPSVVVLLVVVRRRPLGTTRRGAVASLLCAATSRNSHCREVEKDGSTRGSTSRNGRLSRKLFFPSVLCSRRRRLLLCAYLGFGCLLLGRLRTPP
jgi:hypothetical protein